MINSVVVIICDLHLVNLVKYRETQVEWTEQRRRSRSRWETRRRRGCKSRIETKIQIFEVVIFTSFVRWLFKYWFVYLALPGGDRHS